MHLINRYLASDPNDRHRAEAFGLPGLRAFVSAAYDEYGDAGRNAWVFSRRALSASHDDAFVAEVARDALDAVTDVDGRQCSCEHDCCGHILRHRVVVSVGPRYVIAEQSWAKNV
jgi:hypothetical protein